jgi:hypothetical protein
MALAPVRAEAEDIGRYSSRRGMDCAAGAAEDGQAHLREFDAGAGLRGRRKAPVPVLARWLLGLPLQVQAAQAFAGRARAVGARDPRPAA